MRRARNYLRSHLDTYLKSLQNFVLKQKLGNLSKEFFKDWTFDGQHLSMVFMDKSIIEPIFINESDKQLYYENFERKMIPISFQDDFYLQAPTHDVTNEQGGLIWFTYIPEQKRLSFLYREKQIFVDTDKLSSMQQLKLSPKNQAKNQTVDIPIDQLPPSMLWSSQSSNPHLQPVHLPLPPIPARIQPHLVQTGAMNFITIGINHFTSIWIRVSPQPMRTLSYKLHSRARWFAELLLFCHNAWFNFQPVPHMQLWSFDPITSTCNHDTTSTFQFKTTIVTSLEMAWLSAGRYNLLYAPFDLELPWPPGPHI